MHILKFEGYNNPEEAFEGLVGRTLLVDANDRPALDDDEDMTYFVSDLIGMHCVNLVRSLTVAVLGSLPTSCLLAALASYGTTTASTGRSPPSGVASRSLGAAASAMVSC